MNIAVFGKKLENNLDDFLETLKIELISLGINEKNIDYSYFDTDVDSDYKDPESNFEKIKRSIFKADALIIESSCRSEGISFVSGFALALNKPLIMLFNENTRKGDTALSTIILGTTKLKRSYVHKYSLSKKDEFQDIISSFISDAIKLTDTKFYIILPSEITRYLEWWSFRNRQPKVNKIRQLLFNELESDEEWNELNT